MTTPIRDLPVTVTSFAFGAAYQAELDGMISTVREFHPTWSLVVGRGPVSGSQDVVFAVDPPLGNGEWRLPVTLQLNGTTDD